MCRLLGLHSPGNSLLWGLVCTFWFWGFLFCFVFPVLTSRNLWYRVQEKVPGCLLVLVDLQSLEALTRWSSKASPQSRLRPETAGHSEQVQEGSGGLAVELTCYMLSHSSMLSVCKTAWILAATSPCPEDSRKVCRKVCRRWKWMKLVSFSDYTWHTAFQRNERT